jgi:hypothetical protein
MPPISRKEPVNPFYVVLLLAGIVFFISACAYGMMAYRGVAAPQEAAGGLLAFLQRHGGKLLAAELAVLALATAGAIWLDARRAQASKLDKEE